MSEIITKRCWERGQKILKLEKELKEKQKIIDEYQEAIGNITFWLSASITNSSCKQYVEACNKCFEVDIRFEKKLNVDESKHEFRK